MRGLFRRGNRQLQLFRLFFMSKGMLPEVIREQTQIIRDPLRYSAFDYRPVIAVFHIVDQ